jgi:hypothetical protein
MGEVTRLERRCRYIKGDTRVEIELAWDVSFSTKKKYLD